MRKTNLLWLSDRLDILGGVETLLLNLANKLDRSRFNVYSGVFKMGYVASYFEELGVQVIHIPRKGNFDLQVIPRLAKTIREQKIDLIHTHGLFPGIVGRIACKLTGKKVISTYHFALHEDGHPRFTKMVTRMALLLADNVDIFAIGEDWKGKFDFLKEYCEVVIYQGLREYLQLK